MKGEVMFVCKKMKLFQKCKIIFLETVMGEETQVHYLYSQKHSIVTKMEGLLSLPTAVRQLTFP